MSRRTLVVLGLLVLVVAIVVLRDGKSGSAQPVANGRPCLVQVSADVLNVRSGPDSNASVVEKLANGATVAATTTVRGGYRELAANHWAATQFLKTFSGNC
jgi:hypothetical protein